METSRFFISSFDEKTDLRVINCLNTFNVKWQDKDTEDNERVFVANLNDVQTQVLKDVCSDKNGYATIDVATQHWAF